MKWITVAALAAGAFVTGAAPTLAQPRDPNYCLDGRDGYGRPCGPYDNQRYDNQRYGYQPSPPGPRGWDIDRRIDGVQRGLNRARDERSISERDYWRAQNTLNGIRRDERRDRYYHGGQLNDRDRSDLAYRLDRLNDQIHQSRRDERPPWAR